MLFADLVDCSSLNPNHVSALRMRPGEEVHLHHLVLCMLIVENWQKAQSMTCKWHWQSREGVVVFMYI